MKNCKIVQHPLLSHKLALLRNKATPPWDFRRVLSEMSGLLTYEAIRDLKTRTVKIETPMGETSASEVVDEKLVIVPILRAGAGMLDAVLEMVPFAEVGHAGIYRDKFIKNTVEYFFRLPKDIQGKRIILLDPLLATGDTAVAAVQRLKDYGATRIQFICLLASPQGLSKMEEFHPEVLVYTLAVEKSLDAHGYLLPGLGDAGDRLYGTL